MSERVICEAECDVVMLGGRRVQRCSYEPDPDAPGVDEIVAALTRAAEALPRMRDDEIVPGRGGLAGQCETGDQLDALVARLEDE